MTPSEKIFSEVKQDRFYKFPLIFLGIYIAILLSTVILANRLTQIAGILEPGGIYYFPLAFPILDIMGEVYGYSYPRLFIWIGAFCEICFAIAITMVAHFPYPDYFTHADAYKTVLDPTIRFVISSLLGTLVGYFMNIYFLAKWKVRLQGRSYILRCISATAIGQAALTIIVDIVAYTGKITVANLIWMMFCGYVCKMLYTLISVFPSWIIVKKLKEIEKVDYYDINTDFNPFKLDIENKDNKYE